MTKQPGNRTRRGDRRRRRAPAGMSLMELMVSLAILSGMILIASSLLVRSRRTIHLAQDVIKANADARAVIDRLRADIPSLTKEGFLIIGTRRILYRTDPADPATQLQDTIVLPYLAFTTVSTYRSVLNPTFANAATIDFGHGAQTDDGGTPANPLDDIFFCWPVLCRRARMHDLSGVTEDDRLGGALVEYRADLQQPRLVINNILNVYPAIPQPYVPLAKPPELTAPVPDRNLQAAMDLWPYMIGELHGLRIQWTDGATDSDGRLVWYDQDNPRAGDDWKLRSSIYQHQNPGENAPEYDINLNEFPPPANRGDPLYGALWTFKKTDNWPKAIRFELLLGDDPPRYYEAVVSLLN